MFESIKTVLSTDENVVKFVFETTDAVAEAVLYKYPTYEERIVICCSTQSGCPVGCVFCGTGKFFTRNLTSAEIVQQISHAVAYTGIDPAKSKKFQIMFMSMGEPFLNYGQLKESIIILYKVYPNAQLLVSTSFPGSLSPDTFFDFCRLAKEIPTIGLQVSVHESTDEARKLLIPTNTATLLTIKKAGIIWETITGRAPFFNYCVHEGNNAQEDVDRLANALYPEIWEVTLSVICEKDQSMKNAIDEKVAMVVDFASRMAAVGYSTRVFNPAGQDDIGGGCGQLWFVQEWAKNHKSKNNGS